LPVAVNVPVVALVLPTLLFVTAPIVTFLSVAPKVITPLPLSVKEVDVMAEVNWTLLVTVPVIVVITSGKVIRPVFVTVSADKLKTVCRDTLPLTTASLTLAPYVIVPVPAPVAVMVVPLTVRLPLVTLFGAALFIVIVPPPVLVTEPTVAASFVLIGPVPVTRMLPTVAATLTVSVPLLLLVKLPVIAARLAVNAAVPF
jgi:hypothetical protein